MSERRIASPPGPIRLEANQPPGRFYRGGARIAAFRGSAGVAASAAERCPEDWVGSTTALAGEERLGLTVLPDGLLLRDAIARDPEHWFGPEHARRFGGDTRILVKLLHTAQRLLVHAHPSGAFAGMHLGRAHGKAEAWYILNGGAIHLGLRREVTVDELLALVEGQRTEELLALLHRREVRPGDAVYVPPGLLHSIGEDVFLIEVQEPEDLSIVLEWQGFELDGAVDGHLGLGFATALAAVETRARTDAEIDALITSGARGPSVLPAGAEEFFRLGRYGVQGQVDMAAGFGILIVTEGAARLDSDSGSLQLSRGDTVLVPFAAGPLTLTGHAEVVFCRPPDPSPAETQED